jgi:hypothetical protein
LRDITPELADVPSNEEDEPWQQKVMTRFILTILLAAVFMLIALGILILTGTVVDFNEIDHLFWGSLIVIPILAFTYIINEKVSRTLGH